MTKDEAIKSSIGLIPFLDKIVDTPLGEGLHRAMDVFSKHQTVSFTNWTTSAECDYSCSDEDEWNNIHNPQETITSEQLYDKFIEWQTEQQNKP